MQFALPSNLKNELIPYDSTLKSLARSKREEKTTTSKPRFPLGKIPPLIPASVVSLQEQEDAIERINGAYVPNRYQIFTKLINIDTEEEARVTVAILYHYEQCWLAAWFPPGGNDSYIYGYAYAFKDTALTGKTISNRMWTKRDEYNYIQIGPRSYAFTYIKEVTREDIIEGDDVRHWRDLGVASYYEKSAQLAKYAIEGFENALRNRIPTWTDNNNIFSRLFVRGISDVLQITTPGKTYTYLDPFTWELNADSFLKLCDYCTNNQSVAAYAYKEVAKVRHILDKPFFRKWINLQCQQTMEAFNNPETETEREVKQGWKRIFALAENIAKIHEIWPDCPIDYYQTYANDLMHLRLRFNINERCTYWLREHMPVASYFSILRKEFEAADLERRSTHNHDQRLGLHVYGLYTLEDTFSMLGSVLEDHPIEPPKRWRLSEFHDYLQAESWKIQNPNIKLPQDLFPSPIKVCIDGEVDWSFFQPIDTHQLAQWGKAVRNCVGSATHYAESIKKKKHFIVLCMIENKPMFTIQLQVDSGCMSVKQIAGISNSSLTQDQKDEYTTAFRIALQKRDEQLKQTNGNQHS